MTSDADRALLLQVARAAIAAHLSPQFQSAISDVHSAILRTPGAAFVTLHLHGALRGCIGRVDGAEPLGIVVRHCAVSAASADPRFPPVVAAELAAIDIEISLLGPLEAITGPQDIVIGRHGLVIEDGRRRGLLLPQVATDWNWDADAFLSHTCEKAGLPRDAWRHDARLWRFEAEVFAER